MRTAALITFMLSVANPVLAADISFSFPVNCALGTTCFLQQYVDHDPSEGAYDHQCGPLSYDGHTGTDIRLINLQDMLQRVPVLAAQSGRVRAVRDGVQDIYLTEAQRKRLGGRGCGNGVLIEHQDGWQTQYCHLRRGSIRHVAGDEVAQGEIIGEVGLSGFTEFPHLEFIVRQNGEVRDPFGGTNLACAPETVAQQANLWAKPPPYQAGGFLSAGFHDQVPTLWQLRLGQINTRFMHEEAGALVLWAFAFGGQENDELHFTIFGPSGRVIFSHKSTLPTTQAEYFRASGRKRQSHAWRNGIYEGRVELWRDGIKIDEINTTVTFPEITAPISQ